VGSEADEKTILRVRMREALAAVPARRRALEEELVNAAVVSDPRWEQARTVLLYRHKGPEFSVVSLGNAAFRQGKRVVFPRVADRAEDARTGDRGRLSLHRVEGWHELRPGAFGIPEPDRSATEVDPDEVELAVVPGLAWDEGGFRLGQGGGYYDRLLPHLGAAAWGVGFDVQRVERVPREDHDRPVDRVLTAVDVVET